MEELEKAVKTIRAYADSTRVRAFLVDQKGKNILPGGASDDSCPFCRIIQEKFKKAEECCRAHLYGSYQAEYFGEAYIFFCPFGLVHWAAPVMAEHRMACALVAGPVLMTSPEDALITDILVKQGISADEIALLYHALNGIPILKPQTVNSMALILFAAASHLSKFGAENILAVNSAFFEQQASISQCLHGMKNGIPAQIAYPLEKEKELAVKIRLGDKAGAKELLNEILGTIFFAQGNSLETIRTRVTELVVTLSRAALEGGADNQNILNLNSRYLAELNNIYTLDEMAIWLSGVMARFTESVFNLSNVKNIDIIYKATTYLRENYMHEITLEKVAKVVALSPTYFSKLFKDEMKQSFVHYLNGLRIEKSKKFLLDDAIPLVHVAGLSGFQDQSYFTKVFKKMTGVSPGEFRKSRGLAKYIG
ncbi:MAG: PocR ligand-binding domain-containing protein [Bacillota bacterium]